MRANKRGKPKSYEPPLKFRSKDGMVFSVTTWPFSRKDKQGKQHPIDGMTVSTDWLAAQAGR